MPDQSCNHKMVAIITQVTSTTKCVYKWRYAPNHARRRVFSFIYGCAHWTIHSRQIGHWWTPVKLSILLPGRCWTLQVFNNDPSELPYSKTCNKLLKPSGNTHVISHWFGESTTAERRRAAQQIPAFKRRTWTCTHTCQPMRHDSNRKHAHFHGNCQLSTILQLFSTAASWQCTRNVVRLNGDHVNM